MVTETWLTEDDNTWLECCDLSKNGYQIHSANRKNRRGGGLAIITTTNMKIKLLEKGDKSSFEYAVWKISTNNSFMTLLAVYHPPHHKLINQQIQYFWMNLQTIWKIS